MRAAHASVGETARVTTAEDGPKIRPTIRDRISTFVLPTSLAGVFTLVGLLCSAYGAWTTHKIDARTRTSTNMNFEPYLDAQALDKVYLDPIPAAVQDAVSQYNHDA